MEPQHGIQETKEALICVNRLTLLLLKHFKDGMQMNDALSIAKEMLENEELRNTLSQAVEGCSKIPSEIKDISGAEGLELAKAQIDMIPAILASFKG